VLISAAEIVGADVEHLDRLAADQVLLDQGGPSASVTPPYQWDLEDANHRSATTSSPPPQAHL
jgi:hypothetical protein